MVYPCPGEEGEVDSCKNRVHYDECYVECKGCMYLGEEGCMPGGCEVGAVDADFFHYKED